jgi:hypothetical protein
MVIEQDLLQKIYARIDIDKDTMCFHYLGSDNGQDYGRMWAHGKNHSVHRVMYHIFFGDIPPDKEVHHTCGVRSCCNIAHLALVTHRQNVILTPQYTQLRWERLQALVEAHLDLALCGVTHLTSTDLSILWGKSCRGSNLLTYLTTLADVYPGEFEWSLVKKGRGRKPHLFAIRMSQTLIDQLIGDEARAASAVKTASPSAEVLHPMASLVLAV